MKKHLTKFLFIASLVLVVSCTKSDVKQNAVFEKSLPDSKAYKDELVKQIKAADQSSLAYYFNSYEEKDGKEYLDITIEGKNLEAHTLLLIKNWDQTLQPLKEFKGKGYGGSELVNLKFDIVQDSATTEFVYLSASEIVD